jgi:hypothetical protein
MQRKEAPKAPPTFSGCTTDNTLTEKPNQQLATAVTFASDLVDAAIGAVGRNDKSETYRIAVARHFINPAFSDLKEIFRNFRRIWFHLKPENFACAASDTEMDECEKVSEGAGDLAFTPTQTGIGVGPSVLCPAFWFDKLPCRAITLIHESAHAVGIGNGSPHPPNRASASYPDLAAPPPAGQTAALRMNNPDAYAHFAAHIGRETDTPACGTNAPDLPLSPRGAVKVEDPAPGPKKK